MTTVMDSNTPSVPEFSLGDRMWKSRRSAGIKTAEMARRLRVTPTTIGNWEAERRHPSFLVLRFWADETRVPLQWLLTGEAPDSTNGGYQSLGQLELDLPGYVERPIVAVPLDPPPRIHAAAA